MAAVAFGQIRVGKMQFKGHQPRARPHPQVTTIDKDRSGAAKQYLRGWPQLVEGWRTELEAAGQGFASGDARVDPKRGRDTCKTCDQHTFCRIAEKAPFGVAHGEEADD